MQMDNYIQRRSGLLVPAEPRGHMPQHCELMGFEAVGVAGSGSSDSPWKTWTGSLDGTATSAITSAWTNMVGGDTPTCVVGMGMLDDTYGVVMCADSSTSLVGDNLGTLRIAAFSISGTTVTVGSTSTFSANFYYGNGGIFDLVPVDSSRIFFGYCSHGAVPPSVNGRVINVNTSTLAVTVGTEYNQSTGWSMAGGAVKLSTNKLVFKSRSSPILVMLSGDVVTYDTLLSGDPYYPYGYDVDEIGRIDDTHVWLGMRPDGNNKNRMTIVISGTTGGIANSDLFVNSYYLIPLDNTNGTHILNAWNGTNYNLSKVTYDASYNRTLTALTGGSGVSGVGGKTADKKSLLDAFVSSSSLQVNVHNFDNDTYTKVGPTMVYTYSNTYKGCAIAPCPTTGKAVVAIQNGSTVYLKVLRAA